jgi:hypothetical protein
MHSRRAEEAVKVKPLPSWAVDEPMTLWSAAGGDAYGAMKEGPLPRQPRGDRDEGARAPMIH